MELAREVLGGKYEFVLTTHIDRDHVHNHLIFNAVSFQDHRHYHSNSGATMRSAAPATESARSMACPSSSQAGTRARATSNTRRNRTAPATRRSCAPPSTGSCPAAPAWRTAPPPSAGRVRTETGQVHLRQGTGPERFTRLKALGADYAEEALTARIAGRPSPSRQPKQRTGKPSLLIDIQNNIKAQQSAGYKHWATIENLKRAAETLNFLTGAWHRKFGGPVRAVRRGGRPPPPG